jgi:hypothetical protein
MTQIWTKYVHIYTKKCLFIGASECIMIRSILYLLWCIRYPKLTMIVRWQYKYCWFLEIFTQFSKLHCFTTRYINHKLKRFRIMINDVFIYISPLSFSKSVLFLNIAFCIFVSYHGCRIITYWPYRWTFTYFHFGSGCNYSKWVFSMEVKILFCLHYATFTTHYCTIHATFCSCFTSKRQTPKSLTKYYYKHISPF